MASSKRKLKLMNIDKYLKFNKAVFVFTWVALMHITQLGMAQRVQQVSISSGLQRTAGMDFGYSPLKYAGIRSVISLNYEKEATTRTECLYLNFAQGVARSRGGNSMDTWSINLLSYIFYHSAARQDTKILFGWSLQNELNQRFHRSFTNYNNRMDYFTSVGPALGYLFPVSWEDKKLRWKTTAHMQALGFKFASDYISSEPRETDIGGKEGGGGWPAADVFWIGRDWSVGCWSEIRYESNSGNSMAVQHQFDFQQLSVAQDVIRVRNSFLINICVRL